MPRRLNVQVLQCKTCPNNTWSVILEKYVCTSFIIDLSARPIDVKDLDTFPSWCPLPEEYEVVDNFEVEGRRIRLKE
jgi:hypothetical protein